MDHISSNNYYRKQLPEVFTAKGRPDQQSYIKEKIKNFAPVPLPPDMKKIMEHQKLIEKNATPFRSRAPRNVDL